MAPRKERLAVRDDTSDSPLPRDADHIWLRQSVTFAVNGQTRTLELALPLRPGATPEEVESLLDEAEAGMRRLSRRLDAHLAEITGAAQPTPAPAAEPAPTMAARAPTARATSAPQSAIAERPAPQPAASTSRATPTPAPQPAVAAARSGPDLTRAEFLAAAGALGLDARTVMERLNVRTLSGIDLREALDLLRRQVVRDGGGSAASAPVAQVAPASVSGPRFEEEDDGPAFEVSYPDFDDLPSDDDESGEDDFAPLEAQPAEPAPPERPAPRPARAASAALDDVPDLDDLLHEPSAPTTPAAAPAAAPAATSAPEPEPADAPTRAMIATLRAAHAGGQPTEHQRTAFRHVIINQLGETIADPETRTENEKKAYGEKKAASVARAVWELTVDRLGPDQLDALIRWGKADAFAEEVESVLELLREEYKAKNAQKAQQAPQTPATLAPAARRAAARPTPEQPAEQPAEQPHGATTRGRSGARGGAGSRGDA